MLSPKTVFKTEFYHRSRSALAAQGIQQIHERIGSFVKVLVNFLPELRQLSGMFLSVHTLSLTQFLFIVKFCLKSNHQIRLEFQARDGRAATDTCTCMQVQVSTL